MSTWTPNLTSTVTVVQASLCTTGMRRTLIYKEQRYKEQQGDLFFSSIHINFKTTFKSLLLSGAVHTVHTYIYLPEQNKMQRKKMQKT